MGNSGAMSIQIETVRCQGRNRGFGRLLDIFGRLEPEGYPGLTALVHSILVLLLAC